MNENAKIRQSILEVLYEAREANEDIGDDKEWVSEAAFDVEPIKKRFALAVLEEMGWITFLSSGSSVFYMITGAGVLACEQGQGEC